MTSKSAKKFTLKTVEKLIAQQGKCFYCGFPMPLDRRNPDLEITQDHFIPKSKGGPDKKNIVLCHRACNLRKGDQDPTGQQIFEFNQFRCKIRENRASLFNLNAEYRQLGKECLR